MTKVRLSLDVSSELNDTLDEMAEKTCSSKSDVLRKSIALMEVAVQEKSKGNHTVFARTRYDEN